MNIIRISYNNTLNEQVLEFLRGNCNEEECLDLSPVLVKERKCLLSAHPDIVGLLWNDFTRRIPVSCQWVVYNTAVLVAPETGIIFGIAEGSNPPLIRFDDADAAKVISLGGRIKLINQDGVYADSTCYGRGWVYCFSFIKDIDEFCRHSFLKFNGDSEVGSVSN